MRDTLIILAVWLAAVLGLGAAPPAIPERVEVAVGGVEFFDIKLEAGKQLGMLQHFDKTDCIMVRLWSDDPAVQSWMVIGKRPGIYHVAAWTVGEGKGAKLAIVVGGGTKPPVDPPPPPATGLYFLVVRPDGPASPAHAAIMGNLNWVALKAKGHLYKDKTVAEAAAIGIVVPAAPCVVTLRHTTKPDGSTGYVIVRGPVEMPKTAEDILNLPTGVK